MFTKTRIMTQILTNQTELPGALYETINCDANGKKKKKRIIFSEDVAMLYCQNGYHGARRLSRILFTMPLS